MRTEIFNERITAVQDAKHVIRADSAAKKSLREQLENDVEKFLSQGGSINTLSGIDFKPKQPSKRVERIKPWREVNEAKNNKYEHYKGNTALRDWCKAKHNRVLVIAKVMGVPANYISQRIIGRCVVQIDAFKDEYLPAIKRVEKMEQAHDKAQ